MPTNPDAGKSPVAALIARPGHTHAALVILAVLAVIAALYIAQAFVVPLLIGVLASYTLFPLVEWLTVHRMPRPLAAALVVVLLTGGFGWVGYALSDDVATMIEKLPEAARKLRQRVSDNTTSTPTPLQNVQEAARELEKAAASAAGEKVPARAAPAPPPPQSSMVRDYILAQSALLVGVAVQAVFVLLLVYFLLASGHLFREKIVRIFGESREEKKDVVAMLDEIDVQVQRYMLAMLISNVLIGMGTWIAFELLGVESAGVWGVAAGVLHFIPYLGPTLIVVGSAIAGLLQFDSIVDALLVSSVSLVIAGGIGMIFLPWLHSRFARVNAAVLFIALLFFGWMWGVWGLLLGAPLVAIAKVICDRVESLKPAGELLGH